MSSEGDVEFACEVLPIQAVEACLIEVDEPGRTFWTGSRPPRPNRVVLRLGVREKAERSYHKIGIVPNCPERFDQILIDVGERCPERTNREEERATAEEW